MNPFSEKGKNRLQKGGNKAISSHLNNGEKLEFVEPQKGKRHGEPFFNLYCSTANG